MLISPTWTLYNSDYDLTSFSINMGKLAPDVAVSLDSEGSGITSFEVSWQDGVPTFPYQPVVYVSLPANWSETHAAGDYWMEVLHSGLADIGGGVIGAVCAVSSDN